MKKNSFSQEDMKAFEPSEKIALVATVNPEGLVHITLITSLMAKSPTEMMFGQFSRGLSKWFLQKNPNASFLILNMDKNIWRGKMRWIRKTTEGPEYELYNDMPIFRYNSYFGINSVHYLDLIETRGKESLPVSKIVPSALLTKLAKGGARTGIQETILNAFSQNLFNQLDTLKFISFVGEDGFPVIVPIIQCQAADSRRLIFSPMAYSDELKGLKEDTPVSIFALNMQMQSVLTRGIFNGFRRNRLIKTGSVDINWVYNSIPPIHAQIYPEVELKPVVNF
jgi:hypothetical protein